MNLLVADVGGTKVRTATFRAQSSGALTMEHVARYSTSHFVSLEAVLETFLQDKREQRLEVIAVGVAGPVAGTHVQMTNLPWAIDTLTLTEKYKCPAYVVNDMVAHGYGVIDSPPVHTLKPGTPLDGNKAVLAAGTGLGQCVLYKQGSHWIPTASEGGHMDYGPSNETQTQLLRFLQGIYPEHVSWERVLSGKYGFSNLYRFFCRDGSMPDEITGPWLIEQAHGGNQQTIKALDLFFSHYGAHAGNLALQACAVGGIYLAGGIARGLLPQLRKSSFSQAFVAKGRMRTWLEKVPVYVVTDVESPVHGLARFAYDRVAGG